MKTPTDKEMVEAAHRLFHDEGRIEIDPADTPLPTARVSRADENPEKGAYVLAGVWVEDSEARRRTGG